QLQVGEPIMLTASASSGKPVSFRVVSGPAELQGDVLVPSSVGRVEIEAEQTGDATYLPAKAQRSLQVIKRSQEILVTELKHNESEHPRFAFTATSGLPVTLSLVSGRAQITENQVALIGTGPVVIKAIQVGDT